MPCFWHPLQAFVHLRCKSEKKYRDVICCVAQILFAVRLNRRCGLKFKLNSAVHYKAIQWRINIFKNGIGNTAGINGAEFGLPRIC